MPHNFGAAPEPAPDPALDGACPQASLPEAPQNLLKEFNQLATALWGLLGVLGLCFVAAIAYGTGSLDNYARERSLHLATISLQRSSEAVGLVTRDYAVWDEAHASLNSTYDPAWATREIGDWAFNEMDMQMSAVIDADGRLIFFMQDGVAQTAPAQDRLTTAMSKLADRARTMTWEAPAAINTFMSIDGAIAMVSAVAVTPEKTRRGRYQGRPPQRVDVHAPARRGVDQAVLR